MAARARSASSFGLLSALLALGLLGAVYADGPSEEPPESVARTAFRHVTEAWQAQDPARITGAMPGDSRLRLVLKTSAIRGTYSKPQARRVLKAYFEKLSAVRLKDVTPAGHKDDRSYRVRQFEYQYVAEGEGKGRTLLRITLKAEGKSEWALVAVEEASRRRFR